MTEQDDQSTAHSRFMMAALEAAAWKAYVENVFAKPDEYRDIFGIPLPFPIPADFSAELRRRLELIGQEKNAAGRRAFSAWMAEMADIDLLAAAAMSLEPWTEPTDTPPEPPQPRLRLVGDADEA